MNRISLAVILLACAGCKNAPVVSKVDPAPVAQSVMVELKTERPLEKPYRSPTAPQKASQAFLVPEGTKFLSRGAKVTSSDMEELIIGELAYVTDGDKDDWMDFVEFSPGLQWVQLDLGKSHALHAILVWHSYYPGDNYHCEYSGHRRVYEDVVVQISNDPAFKKEVTTVFNNDHDNSSGLGKGKDDTYIESCEGRWINPKGVEGRYVRLYSNGYKRGNRSDDSMTKVDINNYIEVEVYGK